MEKNILEHQIKIVVTYKFSQGISDIWYSFCLYAYIKIENSNLFWEDFYVFCA